jgi:hypothetical protein
MKKFFAKKMFIVSLFSICLSTPIYMLGRSVERSHSTSPPPAPPNPDDKKKKDDKTKDHKSKIEKHRKHAIKEIEDIEKYSKHLSKKQKQQINNIKKQIKKAKKKKQIDNLKKKAIRIIESSYGGKQKASLQVDRKENDEKLTEMSRMPVAMKNVQTKMLIQNLNNQNKAAKNMAAMKQITNQVNALYQQMTRGGQHGGGGSHPHGGGGQHRSEFRNINSISNTSQLINLINTKKPNFVFMYSYIAGDNLNPTDIAMKSQQIGDLCERAWILVVKFDCSNSTFASMMQNVGHPFSRGNVPEEYPVFSMFSVLNGVQISKINDIPAIKVLTTRHDAGEVAREHTVQSSFTSSVMDATQSYLNQTNWHDNGLNPNWKDKARRDVKHTREKIQEFLNKAPWAIRKLVNSNKKTEEKVIKMINEGIDVAIASNPAFAPLRPIAKQIEKAFNKWQNKKK